MADSLFRGFQVILFYGTSMWGRRCLRLFKGLKIPVDGFVVSDDQPALASVEGLPVYKYSKLAFCKETTLIIQTCDSKEVEEKLRDSVFCWMNFPIDFWKAIK